MAKQYPARSGLEVLTLDTDPVAGTDEVQTVTVTGTPTGGTYRLQFKGQRTDALAHDAAAATVDTQLEALTTVGAGNVAVTGSAGGPYTVTFGGDLARANVPELVPVDVALEGGTDPDVTVVETTPGVDASHRGAPKHAVLSANGKLHINTGTAKVPVWSRDPDVV